ncbi:Protoporphyrinogen oxidase [Pilatotrama ljubarskyi]|nr:Protoporphyrinogen oxidase [Pilatotrama ljubarskyi]
MGPPRSVAIIGGGLSGLSAAFYISRRFPAHTGTRIALVERSPRLGGWVRSERVRVKDRYGRQADVLLESGPRTLRPTSKAIMELIHLLDLTPALLTVSRSAPAARNRFLHIPGTKGLVAIPGSLPSLLVSPLAKILLPAMLRDVRRTDGVVLNASSSDESVDGFLTRHFGPDFARTLGSALVHGIYAADSRQLSVRAAFSAMCRLEESGSGSVVRGALSEMLSSIRKRKSKSSATECTETYDLGEVDQLMKGVSVYSFRDGMQTLTDAIVRWLKQQEHVELVQGDSAVSLNKTVDGQGFQVTTSSGKQIVSSHLISAVPLPLLHNLLSSSADTRQTSNSVHAQPASPPRPVTIATEHARKVPPPPFPHPALSARSGRAGCYEPATVKSGSESPYVSRTKAGVGSSALPLPLLPHLLTNPSSSVTVVNLVFPPCDTPIHPEGFGYLIPRPRLDYPSPLGSSLGILGTVFDSSALAGQDVSISADHRSPRFTKVTVMLGGPYGPPSPDPQSSGFLPALLVALVQHLGRSEPLPEPCLVRIRQHQDCIPTPTVGHVVRMAELRAAVKETWGDNAAVIGAGVGGVSVGDCIESGRRVALEL